MGIKIFLCLYMHVRTFRIDFQRPAGTGYLWAVTIKIREEIDCGRKFTIFKKILK